MLLECRCVPLLAYSCALGDFVKSFICTFCSGYLNAPAPQLSCTATPRLCPLPCLHSAIYSALGIYAEAATPAICSQIGVASLSTQDAVMQWTVGATLAAQAHANASDAALAGAKYGINVSFILSSTFCVFCMQVGSATAL